MRFPIRYSKLMDWLLGRPGEKRFFISHSYQDSDLVGQLIPRLPKYIIPFVFPPIEVSPRETVSEQLITELNDCAGLIYVGSDVSNTSFWVHFERRFAKRANKPVVRYDAVSQKMYRDEDPEGSLAILLWNPDIPGDTVAAREIAVWLHERRGVGSPTIPNQAGPDSFEWDESAGLVKPIGKRVTSFGETDHSLKRKCEMKAPVTLFVSNSTFRSPWPFADEKYWVSSVEDGIDPSTRVEVAWLEEPDPEAVRRGLDATSDSATRCFRQRVLDSLDSEHQLILVKQGQIQWPRVDDLLVRLEFAGFQFKTIGPNWRNEERTGEVNAWEDAARTYRAGGRYPNSRV